MRKALWVTAWLAIAAIATPATAGGGYFSDLDTPVTQPGQEIYVHWNAKTSEQTLVLQPEFAADSPAEHFGIVVPTPHPPKVGKAPETLFSDLLAWTALSPKKCRKRRPRVKRGDPPLPDPDPPYVAPTFKVLDSGTVGTTEWTTVRAQDASALYDWLKTNKYNFAADEETLESYVRRYWVFTIIKADTSAAARSKAGRQHGRVAPVQITFKTNAPILPLAPIRGSVKGGLDTLFYINAPYRMSVPGGEVEFAKKIGRRDAARIGAGPVELPRSAWDKNSRKHDFKALGPFLPAGSYLTKVRTRIDGDALTGEMTLTRSKTNREYYTFDDCGIEQEALAPAVATPAPKPKKAADKPAQPDAKTAQDSTPKTKKTKTAATPAKDEAPAAQAEPASAPSKPAEDKKDEAKEAPDSQPPSKPAPADAPASSPGESGSGFIDD